MQLGEIGIWTATRLIGEENVAEAARLVETLGFGTFWLGGSPKLPATRPILEATDARRSPPTSSTSGSTSLWRSRPSTRS